MILIYHIVFFEIISRYVKNENIGVFLLQNGDIIIAINQEIRFIKRNGNWLNFSHFSFISSIRNQFKGTIENSQEFIELLKNIYVSALDVSLSHTGGIIAVVDGKNKKLNKIINDIDFLNMKKSFKKYDDCYLFFNEFKRKYHSIMNSNKEADSNNKIEEAIRIKDKSNLDENIKSSSELLALRKDISKRLTKRRFIKALIGSKSFIDIDRKLHAELIGLDGACILDLQGNIISFGAIIENDSGSSGGGRGAATKKLSNYGGFAIKISTDGYIEIYSKTNKIYSIK